MKRTAKIILFFLLVSLVSLALPGRVQAKDAFDDKVVFGDTYQLKENEILNGTLAVLGGTATLETGSQVTGDVALMGGTLEINGTVGGNVSTLGGTLILTDNAIIHGDVTMLGGTLHQTDHTRIDGQVYNGGLRPFRLSFPNLRNNPVSFGSGPFAAVWNFFSGIFSAMVMALLAVLVVLVWPRPVERVGKAVIAQPAVTGGLGLLTSIVLPTMLVLLILTLILIPFSLLGFLILGIAFLFGWIAVGLEVGNRLAALFKQQWNPAATAGLGTLVLGIVASTVGWVQCIGWLVPFTIAMIGLGGVVVTRFGTQWYPDPAAQPSTPVYRTPVVNTTAVELEKSIEPQSHDGEGPSDEKPAL
jgi:hypothetical protein